MGQFYGLIIGLAIGALGAVVFVAERVRSLSNVDFTVIAPPVPGEVVLAVRQAEERYYAGQSFPRRAMEMAQDIAAFLHPPLVYRLDFSVGPFRLKGHTLAETIPWALENGYLELRETPERDFHWLYVYLAEQPGLADWGAAVHLEALRRRHPQLREMTWAIIIADPMLVAKLYSGYLGAGGDWVAWEADILPGPVAMKRLGLAPSVAEDDN